MSIAKSPLATITASVHFIILSIFFNAILFSIFEIIPISFLINFLASRIIFSFCKKDNAIQLQPSLVAVLISFLSFVVRLLKDIFRLGICTPLLLRIIQL